jgi:hypothetical protein
MALEALIGAAIGAGLSHAFNQRSSRRALDGEAVDALVEAVVDMQLHVIDSPAPWTQDQIKDLLLAAQKVVLRCRPRLDERHPHLVRHFVRAMAMFEVGTLVDTSGTDNYRACFDAYLNAALATATDFHEKRTIAPPHLPSGPEIVRSIADDSSLHRLRARIGV